MLTIDDEKLNFISLAEILVKIAIAQDVEINEAANTLYLNLKKNLTWKQIEFVYFCSRKGMISIDTREVELIFDMLDVLIDSQFADSDEATELLSFHGSTFSALQPLTVPDQNTIPASIFDFVEYRSPAFDLYGFELGNVLPTLNNGLQILTLKRDIKALNNPEDHSPSTDTKNKLALLRQELKSLEQPTSNDIELPPKSEKTYLNIIAALVGIITGEHGSIGHPEINNQAELIEVLETQYAGYQGFSKRNLEGKFAKARKGLDNS